MKLYVAVCHDRHADEDVTIHATREQAIDYARKYMITAVASPEALEESDDGERWDIAYEYAEDRAFVVEANFDINFP